MGRSEATPPRGGPGAREAIFAQLAEAGRSEQVAQRLTDAIILGVLAPGERLPSEPELSRRFGVALITVREGLGMLRGSGLVHTRRGREGGSFVTDSSPSGSLLDARMRAVTRVELADMAVYFATVLGGCAERAAERSTDDEGERLRAWLAAADFSTPAAARAAAGGFYLEVAVLSQSPRLVREQIRVQAEYGPLLLLALDDDALREDSAATDGDIAEAVHRHDGARARELVSAQVARLSEGLLSAKGRLERGEVRSAGIPADVIA